MSFNQTSQILEKLNQISQMVEKNPQLSNTADNTIKVIDHVFDKVEDALPKPTFMKESTQFALKASGIVTGVVLLIGIIFSIAAYVSARNTKPKVEITEYDNKGNKTSQSTKTEGDNDLCKKLYKDGKVSKIECLVTKGKANAWKGVIIISLIAGLLLFIPLFKSIRGWHYAKRLKMSNPGHKTFIEYIHKLFGMES